MFIELCQKFREVLFEPFAKLIFYISKSLRVKNTPYLAVINLIITVSLHIKKADIGRQRGFGSEASAIGSNAIARIYQRIQQRPASTLNYRPATFLTDAVVAFLI